MKRKSVLLLALLLASVLIIVSCSPGGGSLKAGSKAPDFKLTSLDGRSVSLSGLRGKGVMLNFWATWCPPCRLEMPHLQAVSGELAAKGVVLLAVNIGENPALVKEFIKQYGYTFTVLLDMDYDVAGKYNVESIPVTYFIDKDGVIKDRIVGAFPNKQAIERYLVKIAPGAP